MPQITGSVVNQPAALRMTKRHSRCGRLLRGVGVAGLLVAGMVFGCGQQNDPSLQRELQKLRETLEEKNAQLESQKATIDKLYEQLKVARALSDEDLEKIFYPTKIQIEGLSGGENYDEAPGDDGVTVYLRPIDQYGDVIKVAGDIRIELYDLAAAEGQKSLGTWTFPPEEAAKLWYGALMTDHYTLKCRWQDRLPTSPEVTIRATFVDYLTQRVMTDQATATVKLRP